MKPMFNRSFVSISAIKIDGFIKSFGKNIIGLASVKLIKELVPLKAY
jgi:hypothetical protein